MTVEMSVKLHMVAYVRDNSIETVVGITKSLTKAQSMMIGEIQKIDPDEARLVLADFAEVRANDNLHVLLNIDELGPLSIQLVTWTQEVN